VSENRRHRIVALLARLRVTLGFVFGAATFVLAQPSQRSIAIGMTVAALGELVRIWAAGHLIKGQEVTSSGPYRWVAHPMYVGSSVMGIGLAIACASIPVALLIVLYLSMTLTAAVRNEEAFLRDKFGDQYDRYRRGTADPGRPFSAKQAIANREHRAVIGLAVVMLLLILKATYNGSFWGAAGP
jgi:protein-S-isoprenylcysteine O-methyltransferase Ste14